MEDRIDAGVAREVDAYLESVLVPDDPVLEQALQSSDAAGLPKIAVSPLQGRFLHVLARAIGARRVLEVGTLGGYSTICLARALPEDGRLVTLELNAVHAEVARANLERAGLGGRVELRLGPAIESLQGLIAEGVQPFDLVFLDADKPSNASYLSAALRLSRPGTVVVVDNVVRDGKVADAASADPSVVGSREAIELLGSTPGLVATALQSVGSKGYDGLAVALVERL